MTSILTGDIIKSRQIDTTIWLDLLKRTLNKFGASPKYWEIFRGDSFQLETQPENALFSALLIKASLKRIDNLDVRISIGIGKKTFVTNTITEANGEAFINSGEAFDTLIKKQNLGLQSPWKEIDEEINLSLELALLTMDYWTPNSAEVFQISLENPTLTQKEIAKKLGITQGRVSERQKRAGLDAILKLEKRYRQLIHQKITSI